MDRHARMVLLILVLLLTVLGATAAWAGSSGDMEVSWQVLSGGGAPVAAGSGQVALNGSLGQTAIGPAAGGDNALGSGFWYGVGPALTEKLYLPALLRNQ